MCFPAAQLLEAIDETADPCDNFFQFACGAWNNKHTIPADKSSYNMFEELHDELQVKLKRMYHSSLPCQLGNTRLSTINYIHDMTRTCSCN